jgi:hypothetical protein
MSTTNEPDSLHSLVAARETLHALGLPADDWDEATVRREAKLRAMARMVGRCRLLPGSFDKRFARDLPTFPGLVTAKQEELVIGLWRIYRRQLRTIRRQSHDWPEGLPDVPNERGDGR